MTAGAAEAADAGAAGPAPHFEIREATEADTPAIYSLVEEFAAHVRLSDEFTATEALLAESLFRGRRVAEVLLGCWKGEPVGFAVFFHNFSTFQGRPGIYLEDLYVRPAYRRRGFGRALLVRVAQIAKERRCGRFEWTVLNWNEAAIAFYESLGAVVKRDTVVTRMTGEAIDRLAEER
jgi:GNAT superfamily N-acetyltransferase